MTKTTKTNKFIVSEDQSQPSGEIGGVRREGVLAARGCTPRGGARHKGVLTARGCSP